MLNIPVPQVMLNRPGVVPLVRQVEAAGVAQHVGVRREIKAGRTPGPGDQLAVNRGQTTVYAIPSVARHRHLKRGLPPIILLMVL